MHAHTCAYTHTHAHYPMLVSNVLVKAVVIVCTHTHTHMHACTHYPMLVSNVLVKAVLIVCLHAVLMNTAIERNKKSQ